MNHISAKDLYLDYYIKNSQNLTVKNPNNPDRKQAKEIVIG